jgi:polyhydroxyalkanoate synthesis regulator phasin
MNYFKKIVMLGVLVVFAITINACSTDPSQDITALKQKFAAINAEEAQGYVPDLFNTIQANIVTMDQEMAASQTKTGMFKDYSKIKELVTKTTEAMVQMEAQLVTVKAAVKAEVEQLLPNLDAMLAEADSYVAAAAKSRALKAKVAALKPDIDALKTSVEQVKRDAAAEKYYAAKAAALGIQDKFNELKDVLTAGK